MARNVMLFLTSRPAQTAHLVARVARHSRATRHVTITFNFNVTSAYYLARTGALCTSDIWRFVMATGLMSGMAVGRGIGGDAWERAGNKFSLENEKCTGHGGK